MEVPNDMDGLLRGILSGDKSWRGRFPGLDDDDVVFIEKILSNITDGSKAVFVAFHPDDERFQYMLLNTNRAGAVRLLARVLMRIAELESET